MKLAEETLLEIVAIVQHGLVYEKDISQMLRDLDLEERETKLYPTQEYLAKRSV
jgi:hypothetical protein